MRLQPFGRDLARLIIRSLIRVLFGTFISAWVSGPWKSLSNWKHSQQLVVDDEPLIRMDAADMVAEEGYEVIEVHSADEAFTLLSQYPTLRLVLSDIQMPGKMDGLSLARHICEHWPAIGVIVASGAVPPRVDELRAAAKFIGKPISVALVRQAIREISMS